MTKHNHISLSNNILNPILENGLEGLPSAISLLINQAMIIERSNHLGTLPYERSASRNGYANGFKDRSIESRIGTLDLNIPQVRNSHTPFYPSALERGQRSEKALAVAIGEMYIQGVSTRRVTAVLEKLCGLTVTSTQVSRAAAELDPMLEAWRSRPIPPIAHLVLDARYEKIRVDGTVRSCAVFTAIGVRAEDATRMIIGTSVSLSEAEIHWRAFLSSLKKRGLFPSGSITSDAHEGLKAALQEVFAGIPWNRCQFHLQQNAQSYVPKLDMKAPVAADIRSIFNAESLVMAKQKLSAIVAKYAQTAPKLSAWMDENLPEGFTVFSFHEDIRQRLRTSNLCEAINKQIKRRTRVASIFPNEPSCLRLVSAILMEISEEWESAKPYLQPEFLR